MSAISRCIRYVHQTFFQSKSGLSFKTGLVSHLESNSIICELFVTEDFLIFFSHSTFRDKFSDGDK